MKQKSLVRQAISLSEQYQDPYIEAYSYRSLGQVYLDQNNHPDAKIALQQAIDLFAQLALSHEVEVTKIMMP